MSIDLSTLSITELRRLAKNVDKAIETAENKRLKEAKAAIEKVAKEYGVSIGALVADEKPNGKAKKAKPAAKKTAAKPKYRNPADPKQTWTGKGRRPKWYLDAVAGGKAEADLLV